MQTIAGAPRPRTRFEPIEAWTHTPAGGGLLCIAAGLIGLALDASLRMPLHMPGWRGVASLAVMVLARCATRLPWAATATAATAAAVALAPTTLLPPHAPLFLLTHGLVLDLLCAMAGRLRWQPVVLGLAAGLANATTPLLMLLGLVPVGLGHGGALASGAMVPVVSHFAFGCLGGLLATQLWAGWQRLSGRRRS
jgi:hypothetical protein